MERVIKYEWKDEYGDLGDGMGPGHIATVGKPTGKMIPRNKEAYDLAKELKDLRKAITEAREIIDGIDDNYPYSSESKEWLEKWGEMKGESNAKENNK